MLRGLLRIFLYLIAYLVIRTLYFVLLVCIRPLVHRMSRVGAFEAEDIGRIVRENFLTAMIARWILFLFVTILASCYIVDTVVVNEVQRGRVYRIVRTVDGRLEVRSYQIPLSERLYTVVGPGIPLVHLAEQVQGEQLRLEDGEIDLAPATLMGIRLIRNSDTESDSDTDTD